MEFNPKESEVRSKYNQKDMLKYYPCRLGVQLCGRFFKYPSQSLPIGHIIKSFFTSIFSNLSRTNELQSRRILFIHKRKVFRDVILSTQADKTIKKTRNNAEKFRKNAVITSQFRKNVVFTKCLAVFTSIINDAILRTKRNFVISRFLSPFYWY